MAITFVDANSFFNSSSTTSNVFSALNVTTGDTIVVGSRTGLPSSYITSVTDTAGNVYRQAFNQLGNVPTEVWYCTNCTGNASNVVTMNYSNSTGNASGAIAQFRGLAIISPIDVQVGKTNLSSFTITSPSFSTAVANSVLIGYAMINDTNGIWTVDTGWTQATVDATDVNIIQYKIVSALQSGVTTTMTNTKNTDKTFIVISLHETISSGGGGSGGAFVF